MKELKQEMTQQINKLEDTIGSLWAGRFKSKRVTSESQLLTTLAYIDLNPLCRGSMQKARSWRTHLTRRATARRGRALKRLQYK